MTNYYKRTDLAIWSGRKTTETNAYWYQRINCIDLQEEKLPPLKGQMGFALAGYACEEGVRQNQGRVGAAKGPEAIRKMLATTALHLDSSVSLIDVGDIVCPNDDLVRTQAALATLVTKILEAGYFPLVLGGGHDIAYGHYLGIKEQAGRANLGILNFDAHFDLRVPADGPNSGTPFYQIAQDLKALNLPFHYLVIGIQKAANTRMLFQTADELGVKYIENKEVNWQKIKVLKKQIRTFLNDIDQLYLSIDLDVFAVAFAPGVSAASPVGILPELLFELLPEIFQSKKLISLDIAECNPTYDIDNWTARLAARLIDMAVRTSGSK